MYGKVFSRKLLYSYTVVLTFGVLNPSFHKLDTVNKVSQTELTNKESYNSNLLLATSSYFLVSITQTEYGLINTGPDARARLSQYCLCTTGK